MTAQPIAAPREAVAPRDEGEVRVRLLAYLERLGLRDARLCEALTGDCLSRARRGGGARDTDEDLLRRGIEEARQLFDVRLGKLLGLDPGRDRQRLAGARAALLLSATRQSTDFLFSGEAGESWSAGDPRLGYPIPVPPEAPTAMPAQPFRFLFFKST